LIRAPGTPDPPVPRLLARLGPEMSGAGDTLVIASGTAEGQVLDAILRGGECRVLVLSALGAHPDARSARLRKLWTIEEQVRRCPRASLTLRLGPILGADSPLWLRLRARPRLGRYGESTFSPVYEDDVLETLHRALDGRAEWEGWYGVAGPEVLTLSEASALAARGRPLPAGAGAWEPPLDEIREHRIPELAPWIEHFDMVPSRVTEQAERWS
jgi:uncharacterized protein YbjT (DUF2867 family)